MSVVDWTLAMMKMLGTKVPQAWPYIVNIAENLKSIIAIATGNQKLSFASDAKSDKGCEIVSLAKQHKLPIEEAKKVAALFEMADSHLS